jgi:hypothetical protein
MARLMAGPLKKARFGHPLRRSDLETRFHRPENAVRPILYEGGMHPEKPSVAGDFVIIDEGDKISASVRDCSVSCKRNVLFGLNEIFDCAGIQPLEQVHCFTGRLLRIIVHNDNRVCKPPVTCLLDQFPKQARKKRGALEGAHAYTDLDLGFQTITFWYKTS